MLLAFAIGAAFLAVFYTQTTDLYGRSEELWEGIFNLIAVCLITPMSLAILRADRSRNKWRRKLSKAFAGISTSKEEAKSLATGQTSTVAAHNRSIGAASSDDAVDETDSSKAKEQPSSPATEQAPATHELGVGQSSNHATGLQGTLRTLWTIIKRPFTGEAKGATAIFFIPFVTTLREGLEGVVFIGGVSLGLPATSIPLPAIVGIVAGLLCGFIVFKAGSFSKVRM